MRLFTENMFCQFQGNILKPSYDAVDIAEVELMDDGKDARDFSSFLLGVSENFTNFFSFDVKTFLLFSSVN